MDEKPLGDITLCRGAYIGGERTLVFQYHSKGVICLLGIMDSSDLIQKCFVGGIGHLYHSWVFGANFVKSMFSEIKRVKIILLIFFHNRK
jgi:hypothetical protein